MVLHIVPYYLALAIGYRAGVGSITQTFSTSSLPQRVGGVGPEGGVSRSQSRGRFRASAYSHRRAFCSAPPEETLLIVPGSALT